MQGVTGLQRLRSLRQNPELHYSRERQVQSPITFDDQVWAFDLPCSSILASAAEVKGMGHRVFE